MNGTWFATLSDLTPKALESGLARLRGLSNEGRFSQYPPNCLEFKALCLAFYNDLRLPSPSVAFREVQNSAYGVRRVWSHDVVRLTASRLPVDFLKIDREEQAFRLFKPFYEQVCNLVRQGHPIPEALHEPHVRLNKPQDRSVARHHIDAMQQRVGVMSCNSKSQN